MDGDTIAAISTATGPAGIAVVRVSGHDAFAIAGTLAGTVEPDHFPFAKFAHFHDPSSGAVADDGILLLFKAPRSYTGEDVAEFQCHGGRIPPAKVLAAVVAAGARPAAPGEFTRRAFLNGKIDLARAEAVMDFIGAASDRAAAAAREQLQGVLSRRIDTLYSAILALEADVEHLLDFDEGEISGSFLGDALSRCRSILSECRSLSATARRGTLLREGALVAICGHPNAGKSSLMNALLGRDRAIVSPIAGTTRDSIEEPFSVAGIPVRLVDTAGLRTGAGDIEAEGIARAEAIIARADVAVEVIDATLPDCAAAAEAALRAGRIPALNKIDAAPNLSAAGNLMASSSGLPISAVTGRAIPVSALTGEGLGALLAAIAERLDAMPSENGDTAVSERHAQCVADAEAALAQTLSALETGDSALVPAAASLSAAAQALGRITGRVWSDDLLDAVFGRFCIGK